MSEHSIVPPRLIVNALRDSGYKNAAYAIAELIDNAIQAGASKVDVLIAQKQEQMAQRRVYRINEIAVLDNGSGMDARVLRLALQFGNGTHLVPEQQNGIGRFGMGLPNSSISQAQRVDVWTWQKGIEGALHSYIDVEEIEQGTLFEVPKPQPKAVPPKWLKVGFKPAQTGTLVVWSKVDRCMWRTGRAIIDNSQLVVGRIYRRFLHDERVKIRMLAFDAQTVSEAKDIAPNDPCYLLSNTSCPEPWNKTPMFELWGEPTIFKIKFQGGEYPVTVKFSYAKEQARELGENGEQAGAMPHGQHAAKNVGVSIIRADRELDLDTAWSNPSEARDRWWGVEVDFPPALDNLFGVTNNKQAARFFSELAKYDVKDLLEEGKTLGAALEELNADEDPRAPLIEIAKHIQTNLGSIRRLVRAQTEGTNRKRHPEEHTTQETATKVTRKRQEEGHYGKSDQQETLPAETRQDEIKSELIEKGVTERQATDLAATVIGRGFKYTFARAHFNGPAFFDVTSKGGAIIISLNTEHPAYTHLVEVLESEVENANADDLRGRLQRARDGLELLLMAWARYEDEQPDGNPRTRASGARWDWGRMASQFLEDDDNL